MAHRILKWTGIAVGAVAAIGVIVPLALFSRGRTKAAHGSADVRALAPALQPDPALVARGEHIVRAISPCEHCHGPGLSGKPFETPAALVRMWSPNLTRGRGGAASTYSLTDWNRALRHGIARDGRRMMIMPSEAFTFMNDSDLVAVVSYVQSLPPADREIAPRRIGILGGALVGAGMMPLADEMVAHDSVGRRPAAMPGTVAYGEYLMNIAGCRTCHGPTLGGRKEGGGPPPAPSLASARQWGEPGFRQTLRTGRTPDGRALNAEVMPWGYFARMTDEELHSIWLYLETVPMGAASRS